MSFEANRTAELAEVPGTLLADLKTARLLQHRPPRAASSVLDDDSQPGHANRM